MVNNIQENNIYCENHAKPLNNFCGEIQSYRIFRYEIWGFHGRGDVDIVLLGCYALNIETEFFSERLVSTYGCSRRHNPEQWRRRSKQAVGLLIFNQLLTCKSLKSSLICAHEQRAQSFHLCKWSNGRKRVHKLNKCWRSITLQLNVFVALTQQWLH